MIMGNLYLSCPELFHTFSHILIFSAQMHSFNHYTRQINKNFKLIFLSIFLLHHTGDVNRIHMLFEC